MSLMGCRVQRLLPNAVQLHVYDAKSHASQASRRSASDKCRDRRPRHLQRPHPGRPAPSPTGSPPARLPHCASAAA